MKYLVSCGCSWVEGYGTSDKKNRLSTLMASKYNLEDINLAEGGGSNQMIFRKVTEWINNNKDKVNETLFLIGWTESTRFEYWDDLNNEYKKIDVATFENTNKDHYTKEELKHWEFYWRNYFNEKVLLDNTNRYILSLSRILPKFIFFNSIGDLKNLTKKYSPEFEYVYNIFLEKSWEEFCGGRYSDLVDNKKDTSLYAENDGHPNDKGNKLFAKHIMGLIHE